MSGPGAESTGLRAVDWLFRNRQTGAITIGQWPNLPLVLFALAQGAAWALAAMGEAQPLGPRAGFLAGLAASLFLLWWSLDEVLRGVNPWRRLLGGAALVYVAWRLYGLLA